MSSKMRVDGIRRDYANEAKARWYASQRERRWKRKFGIEITENTKG